MPSEQTEGDGRQSLAQIASDLGVLIRHELELAKDEMAEKAKSAAVGAGMLSGSALTAIFTLASLTALAVALIALVLPLWTALLIVTVLWAAGTAVLALMGKKKVEDATPFVPEQRSKTYGRTSNGRGVAASDCRRNPARERDGLRVPTPSKRWTRCYPSRWSPRSSGCSSNSCRNAGSRGVTSGGGACVGVALRRRAILTRMVSRARGRVIELWQLRWHRPVPHLGLLLGADLFVRCRVHARVRATFRIEATSAGGSLRPPLEPAAPLTAYEAVPEAIAGS